MLPVLAAASLLLISSPFKNAKKYSKRAVGGPGETVQCVNGPCCLDFGSFNELLGPVDWKPAFTSMKNRERFTVPEHHAIRLCR